MNPNYTLLFSSYGHYLLERGTFAEAKTRLQMAYDTFIRFKGKLDRGFVNIANDLAVAYTEVSNSTYYSD